MKLRLSVITLALVGFCLLSSMASAHSYDRDDSDYPLRVVAYVVHPVGIAMEYGVLRPIHWVVSQPNWSIIFGHEPNAKRDGEYFAWEEAEK